MNQGHKHKPARITPAGVLGTCSAFELQECGCGAFRLSGMERRVKPFSPPKPPDFTSTSAALPACLGEHDDAPTRARDDPQCQGPHPWSAALGYQAGYNVTTGSNNIEVGSLGTSADANTIRIGTQGTQSATYIAGISGTPMTGADVVVSSSGRLGVLPSSARFTRDIQPLDERSRGRWQLRPVTFR